MLHFLKLHFVFGLLFCGILLFFYAFLRDINKKLEFCTRVLRTNHKGLQDVQVCQVVAFGVFGLEIDFLREQTVKTLNVCNSQTAQTRQSRREVKRTRMQWRCSCADWDMNGGDLDMTIAPAWCIAGRLAI